MDAERKQTTIAELFQDDTAVWIGKERDRTLASVEAALGVNLPESYQIFLELFGGGGCHGVEFAGLSNARGEEPPLCDDLIGMNEMLHQQMPDDLPKEWIYFASDDGANYYFDTSKLSDRECPVVAIGPGISATIAPTFIEFVQLASGRLLGARLRSLGF